jgi:hypothetical protein
MSCSEAVVYRRFGGALEHGGYTGYSETSAFDSGKYCDMTPERQTCAVREAPQKRPLLDNGTLTHGSLGNE